MRSGNVINYSVRVAKNIERKMIRDALARLFSFCSTKDYHYIGFGSKYFTDFLLFHKYLHIDKMTSIEVDVENKEKYNFNKPLNCIDLKFGLASEVLPVLNVDSPVIAWLDYDGVLDTSCLKDLSEIVSMARDGSVAMISYNSKPLKPKFIDGYFSGCNERELIESYLKSKIDSKYIDIGEDYKGLGQWQKYSNFLRSVVLNLLDNAIEIKNRGVPVSDRYVYKQIFNFNYKDGVEMSTLGFIIHKVSSEESFHHCQFHDFDFYMKESKSYVIEVPMLTSKEVKSLVEKMPIKENGIKNINLPENVFNKKDIDNFSRIYKYNPIFNDSEMT